MKSIIEQYIYFPLELLLLLDANLHYYIIAIYPNKPD